MAIDFKIYKEFLSKTVWKTYVGYRKLQTKLFIPTNMQNIFLNAIFSFASEV